MREKLRNSSTVEKLILAIIPLGLLHHLDHGLRADHSGWPFRPYVTLFTATLLIYPLLLIALRARSRAWLRAGLIGFVAFFVWFAHIFIEPPAQIYSTWAYNVSTDAMLYESDNTSNLLSIKSPLLGVLSVTLVVILLTAFTVATLLSIRRARDQTPDPDGRSSPR